MNHIEECDRLARVAEAQAKEIKQLQADLDALQAELDSTVKTGLGILEENKRLRAANKELIRILKSESGDPITYSRDVEEVLAKYDQQTQRLPGTATVRSNVLPALRYYLGRERPRTAGVLRPHRRPSKNGAEKANAAPFASTSPAS